MTWNTRGIKAGDTVRVKEGTRDYNGRAVKAGEYTVRATVAALSRNTHQVNLALDVWIRVEDLEDRTPQVGDTIRVSWTETEVEMSAKGVFGSVTEYSYYTPEHRYLAPAPTASDVTDHKVEVLHRPKPALPTKDGSVIVDATIRGITGQTAFRVFGEWRTGDYIKGTTYHDDEHVTEWKLGKVVEA